MQYTKKPVGKTGFLGRGASFGFEKCSGENLLAIPTSLVKRPGIYFRLLSLNGLLTSPFWSGCLVLWLPLLDAMRAMLRVVGVAI
ncbi:hypothetical protein [Solidesulfovibrio alcoholivorans]|uniref:hypothetical protein n=1 Tax=Solidesulfovibrio alcoholivorans TaxID=81406 RepID=UPI0012EBE97A|nr:hypothetical protein [Solidesulfovibrio alcoholivorans]